MAEPLRFPMAGDHPLLRLVQGPSRALRRVVRLLQAAGFDNVVAATRLKSPPPIFSFSISICQA